MNLNLSILIIDKDQADRETLIATLNDEGYHNVIADDGQQAVSLISQHAIGLIFVDTRTTISGCGESVLSCLRRDQQLSNIPVIVTTAVDHEKVGELLQLGANDYLFKPYHRQFVRKRLKSLLRFDELEQEVDDLLNIVIPIGVELSTEHNFDQLLEKILLEAKSLCRADAGTLYLRTKHDMLQFVIVRNDSLNIAMGGATGVEVKFPPLSLYDAETGEPNYHNVATYSALTGETVNVEDAYHAEGFDFSGTIAFDSTTGYRSQSFLTLPLTDDRKQVIGVLQLINALSEQTGFPIPFGASKQMIVDSMARLATVALKAYIREEQLRRQIANLRIEIDETQRAREVAQITETQYFQQLQEQARKLRSRDRGGETGQ